MSLATAFAAVGTGLKVFGQIQQGQQQKQVFEFNAAVNRQKAQLAAEAGKLRVDRLRRQKKTFNAKQQAAFAKAGVRLTGSPLQVLADTATELEFDILIEDFNTRVGVLNATTAAELDILRGKQSQQSSLISAGSSLLTQLPGFVSSGNLGNIPTTGSGTQSTFDRVTTPA